MRDGVAGAAGREGWDRAIDSQCRAGSDRFPGRLVERVRRVRVGVWFEPRDDRERGRAAEPDIGPAGSPQVPRGTPLVEQCRFTTGHDLERPTIYESDNAVQADWTPDHPWKCAHLSRQLTENRPQALFIARRMSSNRRAARWNHGGHR